MRLPERSAQHPAELSRLPERSAQLRQASRVARQSSRVAAELLVGEPRDGVRVQRHQPPRSLIEPFRLQLLFDSGQPLLRRPGHSGRRIHPRRRRPACRFVVQARGQRLQGEMRPAVPAARSKQPAGRAAPRTTAGARPRGPQARSSAPRRPGRPATPLARSRPSSPGRRPAETPDSWRTWLSPFDRPDPSPMGRPPL